VFVRHTSASLVIQENADPSAKRDLERWLDRLVPDAIRSTATTRGPRRHAGHIKAALTATSLSIPIADGNWRSAPGRNLLWGAPHPRIAPRSGAARQQLIQCRE